MRSLNAFALQLTLVVSSAIVFPASGLAVSASQRSVILISVDTLRADRVGKSLTPHIDQLASRGAWFKNAIAAAPWTLPSMGSVFTGLPPRGHALTNRFSVFGEDSSAVQRLSSDAKTLAEVFKEAGYETAAFTGGAGLDREHGFDRGFDVYLDSRAFAGFDETGPAALEWLGNRGGAPFFLFVHGYDVHGQHAQTPGSDGNGGVKFPGQTPGRYETIRIEAARGNPGVFDAEEMKGWREFYDERVSLADRRVGDFLDGVGRIAAVSTGTVVALISDHGEELFERGGLGHGMTLYDEVLKSVLIIIGEGIARKEIGEQVRLLDLPSTLLDLAGVRDEEFAGQAEGASLRPFWEGRPGKIDAASETEFMSRSFRRSVRSSAGKKLILDLETLEREAYDILSDPEEKRNLIESRPEWVEGFAGVLEKDGLEVPDSGRRCLGIAPEAASGSEALAAARALELLGEGKRSEAVEYACRFLSGPQTEAGSLAAVAVFREARSFEHVNKILSEALRRHPNSQGLMLESASALRSLGKVDESIAMLQKAKALDGANARVYTALGYARTSAGDLQGALEEFRQGVLVSSGAVSVRHHFAVGLHHAGRTEEAVKEFRKVWEDASRQPDEAGRQSYIHAALWLCRSLLKSGEADQEIYSIYHAALERTVPGEPYFSDLVSEFIKFLIERKEFAEAESRLKGFREQCSLQGCTDLASVQLSFLEADSEMRQARDPLPFLRQGLGKIEGLTSMDLRECFRVMLSAGMLLKYFEQIGEEGYFERAVRKGLSSVFCSPGHRATANFYEGVARGMEKRGCLVEAAEALVSAQDIYRKLGHREGLRSVQERLERLNQAKKTLSPQSPFKAAGLRYFGGKSFSGLESGLRWSGSAVRLNTEVESSFRVKVFSEPMDDPVSAEKLLDEWKESFLGVFAGEAAYPGMLTRSFSFPPELRPRRIGNSLSDKRLWVAPAAANLSFGVGAADLAKYTAVVSHRWCPAAKRVVRLELFFPRESFDEKAALEEEKSFSCACSP